jgi:hypothetical protein
MEVSFRLDPRLTRGLHMGDRWVSPRTYTRTQAGSGRLVVEAKARVTGEAGGEAPLWTPEDPDVVVVSPAQGERVEIAVRRPGEGSLTVESGGASQVLVVRAMKEGDGLRVDISR